MDHQHGLVTGFAIDKGVDLWFDVREDSKIILYSEAFNIAYSGWEKLSDIYKALTKASGKDIEPIHSPDRPGDIKHSNADISKARRTLGYDPEYIFERGLAEANFITT